jgi:hypothetical protein
MSSITFLENTLVIVLSMLVPMGVVLLIVHIRFLANFLRRHLIARALMVMLVGFIAFMAWMFVIPLNIENAGLFYFYFDNNIWDYSALPAQAINCQFDAVTCTYIKPTPPVGTFDPDTPGSSPWILLAPPFLAAIISANLLWSDRTAN